MSAVSSFVLESVWMRPSFARVWPRTVIITGRPSRSMSNFSANARRIASLSISSIKAANAPPNFSDSVG